MFSNRTVIKSTLNLSIVLKAQEEHSLVAPATLCEGAGIARLGGAK